MGTLNLNAETITRTQWLQLSDMGVNSKTIELRANPYLFVVEINGSVYSVNKQTREESCEESSFKDAGSHLRKYGKSYNEAAEFKRFLSVKPLPNR